MVPDEGIENMDGFEGWQNGAGYFYIIQRGKRFATDLKMGGQSGSGSDAHRPIQPKLADEHRDGIHATVRFSRIVIDGLSGWWKKVIGQNLVGGYMLFAKRKHFC